MRGRGYGGGGGSFNNNSYAGGDGGYGFSGGVGAAAVKRRRPNDPAEDYDSASRAKRLRREDSDKLGKDNVLVDSRVGHSNQHTLSDW